MASSSTDPLLVVAYKGKRTNRSWPQLPEEVISLIASYCLWNQPESPYTPPQHDFRRWFSRMAFACLRDVHELEKGMMSVCPEWRRAIEKHSLWPQVRRILDANDYLTRNMVYYPPIVTNASSNTMQPPIRFTEYQHFRNILKTSCYICRINYPLSNVGLGAAKRHYHVVSLGYITICKDHDRNHTLFCGFCLKDNNCLIKQPESSYEYRNPLAIYVNEDENLWPGVDATCRRCREDCLLRRVSQNHSDMVAIGGPTFDCPDWEARTCIESFLDLAEGTLADVLVTVREKAWLRRFTKYEDLGQQMLASQRSAADEEEEEEVDEDDDSEADRDAMLTRQAPQVRDMALTDWARRRILDGYWLSPADIWYRNSVPGKPSVVPALHPCPWSREVEVETDALGEELPHPLPATLASEVPPTYRLCEQAYLAHMQAVRELLGPAMRNVVRKIVLECAAAPDPITRRYTDPAQLARKISLEEVVRLLREEEGVWYEGVDWIERKRNEEEAERFMGKGDKDKDKEDDGDSTTSGSSTSGGEKSSPSGSASASDATSPVLSTSTLQTTPSPPPLGDEASDKKEEEVSSENTDATTHPSLPPPVPRSTVRLDSPTPRPRFIPVDPVLSTPKLHGTIPYVPVTIAHLPNYSLQALSMAWRQACTPLYHCCCSICERAKLAELNARAAMAALSAPQPPTGGYPQQQYQQQYPPPPPQQQIAVPTLRTVIYPSTPSTDNTGKIELKEAALEGEGEDELEYSSEVEYDDDEEEEEDEEEDAEDVDGENLYDGYPYAISPEPDFVVEDDGVPPTKLVAVPPVPTLLEPIPSHARPRKRSSDEVDVGDETTTRDKPFFVRIPAAHPGTPPKRPRLMLATDEACEVQSTATSRTATATLASRSPSPAAPSLDLLSSPSRVAKRGSQELDVERDDVLVTSSKRVKVQHPEDAVPRDGLPPCSPAHDSAVEEKSIPPLTSRPTPTA